MTMIRWIVGFLLFIDFGYSNAQMLSVFQDLPVRWQDIEKWQWQGQSVTSQYFSSDQDVMVITQKIQQRITTDLRIQRLTSSWLVSFDHDQTHYLILLSVKEQGTQGWLSSLSLKEDSDSSSLKQLSSIFSGLYGHSWHLQSAENPSPNYFILQPLRTEKNKIGHDWSRLLDRLKHQGWRALSCERVGSWCQWEQGSQKLMVWGDPNGDLWHVLWWPKFLGGNQ